MAKRTTAKKEPTEKKATRTRKKKETAPAVEEHIGTAASVDELPHVENIQNEAEQPHIEDTSEDAEPVLEDDAQKEAEMAKRRRDFIKEMNSVPDKDTREMLEFIGITELPKFSDADMEMWFKAVARVRKRDTSVSWCVIERKGTEKFSITKIFGKCSPIAEVGVPMPIEIIPRRFSAKVNKSDINAVRAYVEERIGEKVADMTDNAVMDELMLIEIENYKNAKKHGED